MPILQQIIPTFVWKYNLIAIVLDGMFIPDTGPTKANVPKMLSNMKRYNIDLLQLGINSIVEGMTGELYNTLGHAAASNLLSYLVNIE